MRKNLTIFGSQLTPNTYHLAANLCVLLFLCLAPVHTLAAPIPPNDGFVTDTVGVLTPPEEDGIENLLKAYQSKTSTEIAVIILDSLSGEAISDYAIEVGREWGIGTEEDDNGLLMVIAYADREIFIATGYGLEGALPDLAVKGIIDTDITPYFRDGEYAAGITAGIDSIIKHIGGEYTVDRYASGGDEGSGMGSFIFFVVLVALEALAAFLGRSKSWWAGGVIGGLGGVILAIVMGWWLSIPVLVVLGLLFDYIVSKHYKRGRRGGFWIGGGHGGGGGGGGFGGFSGGSFGGGGAGGSW